MKKTIKEYSFPIVTNPSPYVQGIKFVAPLSTNTFSGNGTATPVSGATTSNTVYAAYFYLPYQLTVNHIGVYITTATAGGTINVGIYNATGTTKLIDSGALDASVLNYVTATVSSIVLQPQFYWNAYSANNPNSRVSGYTNGSGQMGGDVYNFGLSPNATVAGVMPSSLGTLTQSLINGQDVFLTNY